jgi:oligopeptide/dipeptide ABC transporter ATP-binding protein
LPDGALTTGDVEYGGRDVFALSARALTTYRRESVGMIYQDPRGAINPLWTVGATLIEAAVASGKLGKSEALEKAVNLLAEVGIPDGERRLAQYPHQLSGGLLQRVMIVSALMNDPGLIIADEATTALDVTVQAEVVSVFRRLKETRDLSLLFITHDLDLAATISDTIVVMYAGCVVERGTAQQVYFHPLHPYTSALLHSRPNPHTQELLVAIPGRPISAAEATTGCAFASRCLFAQERCRTERPRLRQVDGGTVACHRAEELAGEFAGVTHS